MFNLHTKTHKIDFVSNPPLPDLVVVEPHFDEERKKVVNRVAHYPQDNRSVNEGCHFNRDTMSLSAKVKAGVRFSLVSMPNLCSDPTQALESIQKFENYVQGKLDLQKSQAIQEIDSVPSNS